MPTPTVKPVPAPRPLGLSRGGEGAGSAGGVTAPAGPVPAAASLERPVPAGSYIWDGGGGSESLVFGEGWGLPHAPRPLFTQD